MRGKFIVMLATIVRIRCWSIVHQVRKFSPTSRMASTTESPGVGDKVRGISWVQDSVVDVLNDLFDPKEVARGVALGKVTPSKKKKKKQSEQEDEPGLSEEKKKIIVDKAVAEATPFTTAQAMVTPATRSDFGDYQVNAAMGLAKALGKSPRDCAQQIVDALKPKLANVIEEPEIAGPGFINLRFKQEYVASTVAAMAQDARGRLAIPTTANKQRIVVDYSSPNIAKEMHVGHLRSTIIGDTLCNLLEFVGHDVVRLNHVGDWGTQFGMLVEHLRDEFPAALDKSLSASVDLGDLVALYKQAKKRFDVDEDFKVRAREGVVKLQGGNPEELAAWESLCAASRVEFQKIYDTLGIEGLTERGESFYNPYLNDILQILEDEGLAVESEGAKVVFLDGYTNKDGSPLPMIVQKSDGGFNYATTDLAAVRQRTLLGKEESGEEAQRVLYVTDAGQAQHFSMVFQAARKANLVPPEVSLEHVPFGLVQGEDGKKFATRSGETVRLRDLLDEAIKIAGSDLKSRNENASEEYLAIIDNISRIVGIGAVKYADLSLNRESNYRFSYNRMLSLNGNTAPYMLYAYARICGIIRKASGQEDSNTVEWPSTGEILVSHESEVELMRNLVKLPDLIDEIERELYPSKICDHLFETSQKFNKFYENCSVNNAESPELKSSRLSICIATAGTIRLLLGLLGIEVVEKL